MKYTDEQKNIIKVLASNGARALYIAKRLGVCKKTLLTNPELRAIYDEYRAKSYELFMKCYYQLALSGKHPAISIHFAKTYGHREHETNIDLTKCKTYEDKCNLLDEALSQSDISLFAYKNISDVITRRFESVELGLRIKKLEEKNARLDEKKG